MVVKNKKLLALCMTTYHRPEVVEDIMSRVYEAVPLELFDFYFYDSSTNDDIDILYDEYKEYGNCYLKKIDSNIHSNVKVYDIFQNREIQDNYEYLWMIPDYIFFSVQVVERIIAVMKSRPDMIVLNTRCVESIPEGKVANFNNLLKECAWFLTQYGTMILNCKTVLKEADWKYFSEKYLVLEHRNFSHLAFYFDFIANNKDEIYVYNCRINSRDYYCSKLKKKSGYFKDFSKVWGCYWPKTILALPDFYTYKSEAIKRHAENVGILCVATLAEMKKKGVFGFADYLKCLRYWNLISPSPASEVFLLFLLGEKYNQFVRKTGGIKINRRNRRNKKRLDDFCRKHSTVYIYGAGKIANEYTEYLNKKNILITDYVVTNKDDNSKKNVVSIDEFKDEHDKGLILALGRSAKMEVRRILSDKDITCDVFDKDIDFVVRKFI